mmetsp:Transcript_29392/g.41217  ORF Transcript_29392/g.41217 Transcript_29392/m.41217 type:complete len:109 (-) Transcript_29392:179-505(-)
MDRLPEGVSWTQTPDDVEVYFPVPAETVRTNLEVSISHNQLEVVAPGKKRMNVMLANAHIVDSAVWMFSGEGEDRTVVIHLEKRCAYFFLCFDWHPMAFPCHFATTPQ